MAFFLIFVSFCVVIVPGRAQYQQPYYDDSFYQYPSSYPVIAGRTPNLANDNNRFLFGYTSTATATTVTTTTCTVYTSVACLSTGRRRRFLEDEDDFINSSPVMKVETTTIAEMKGFKRKERKGDRQVGFFRTNSDYPLYELRSTISQRPIFNNYNPSFRRPMIVADADPRFVLLSYIGYITTTSTSTSTATYRSTPVCSSGSGFNQC